MKYRVVVSPSVFREPYVKFRTDWFIKAWMWSTWYVMFHPHSAVFIQKKQ